MKCVNQSFKAAALQFNPMLREKKENINRLYRDAEAAFKNGAKLVVAPEMATTGYLFKDRDDILPYVEPIPGTTTEFFSLLTSEYNSYIAFGMPEKDPATNIYYNTSVLIGPEGYVGKYRKIHLWEAEAHWAAMGDLGVPVFHTNIGNIAMNICMDSSYYETARLAAIRGADILAFHTNSSSQAISTLPARAQQNGLYVISANRSNTENGFHMIGASAIWSPMGQKLAEGPYSPNEETDIDQTHFIYGDIDPKQYNNENKGLLISRRPELYKEIVQFIQPWDYTKNTDPKNVTALAVQYTPVSDKEANMARVRELITRAVEESDNPVKLIVLPELSFTGPVTDQFAHQLSETNHGMSYEFVSELAKRFNTSIVFGIVEQDNDHLYNTALLIGKMGEIKGKYRKTHLNQEEQNWAEAGSKLSVFEIEDLGRIGLLIGDDVLFPETYGSLAIQRADILAIPTSWYGQYSGPREINENISESKYPQNAIVLWDDVSIGAQAYTIFSNFVGGKYSFKGGSGLYTLDPYYGLDEPKIGSQNREEAILVNFETIQQDHWFNQEKLTQSRRPYFYMPLIVENTKVKDLDPIT
ncbi:putative amidohydrolase [Scopulibacillus darangshiensis]|uniref:Putative amidohydrolase n=1 Tax=Scopulibacillus darangshiensis TaxID=442528 RepID=A0A4R2P4Z0_9BACL|nr:nitrilase-related carbon-nitrogen hydrolase [Scopulibacillus darangshiensis]TCP28835.1 putative amidohydrolase [Scopulibacillus darangshiensis]